MIRAAFNRFAKTVGKAAGSPWSFALALAVIVAWAAVGPSLGFSDTWQLVINTGTTIVTFLMVFLLQNTQNRDTTEMKTDMKEAVAELRELIRAIPEADDNVIMNAAEKAQRLGNH